MRNYFLIFFLSYFIFITTKFIFIFYSQDYFNTLALQNQIYAIFWGYKFDFAASSIIALICTLFNFNKRLFSFLSAVLLTTIFLTQIGDILYFDDASRHIGYEILDIFNDAGSLFMTAYSQHFLITIIAICLGIIIFFTTYKLFSNLKKVLVNKFYFLNFFLIILISIFFIRGMFQHIPLHPWQSNEIGNSQQATIALNPTYNIIYSIINKRKKLSQIKLPKVSKDIINQSFKSIYSSKKDNTPLPLVKTKPNVIFLFSESWSAQFMQSYGFEKQTTPVFDELLKQSIRPKLMIANGHRTTEGIFASLTSFQNPLGKTVAKTQLQNYKYDSIMDRFDSLNYTSAFFQGSSKDTSGTGSLVNNLGFQESYGKRDIKERNYEENYWGVQDEDLYNFIFKKLESSEIKEPFVIGINGASTHDSITPKEYKTSSFSKDEDLNSKLNTLKYSDFAMGEFIKQIEKKYPNTIFVLFSDHCGGKIKGSTENYMIPFAIYSKKLIKPKFYDTVLSQRDIAPTIYEIIFGDYSKTNLNFSGKSLISDENFYADYYHNGVLGWIENKNIIEVNLATNKLECFEFDNNLKREKIKCNKDSNKLKEKALSFTTVSQKLLFEGKTKNFITYKEFAN